MKQTQYIKSTDELPKDLIPIWVRVNGSRPMKMYRLGQTFWYYNKLFSRNGNYCGIGDNVLWRYVKK
jgi:hypothetical protein